MDYWFTSDLHLSHEKLRVFLNRPFQSIEEMDSIILDNLFHSMKRGDYLYFAGDLAWRSSAHEIFFRRAKESGIQLYFILGNHDKNIALPHLKKCCWNGYLKDIKITDQKITICHYLMLSWNCSHRGAWHIHGHHHSDVSNVAVGKVMNVCVDLNNYFPVNYEQVKDWMSKRNENWNTIEAKGEKG